MQAKERVRSLFVCLPTNIEMSSLTFNITEANATHVRAYMHVYAHAYTYARTTRIHEVRRLTLSLRLILHFWITCVVGWIEEDEAGINLPRTTRWIQHSIRIEYKYEICLHTESIPKCTLRILSTRPSCTLLQHFLIRTCVFNAEFRFNYIKLYISDFAIYDFRPLNMIQKSRIFPIFFLRSNTIKDST